MAKRERPPGFWTEVEKRRRERHGPRKVSPENTRKRELRRRYGITQAEWAAKLVEQGERCAICSTTEPDGTGWHTDHDHQTGEFRGILCHNCNVGLGHFRDDPQLLSRAIDYLARRLVGWPA